jgi:nucleotide-binding universal stress UspA family protein
MWDIHIQDFARKSWLIIESALRVGSNYYLFMDTNRWIARWENEGGAVPETKTSGKRGEEEPQVGRAKGLRRILVPIDFSPQSLKTLRYAKLLANRFGAKLHLVHVVNPSVLPARHLMLPWAVAETELARSAKTRLKNLAAEFSLSPRPNPFTVCFGAAAEHISEVARVIDADLIAIATRGYTGLKHAFLGSTTERVVREAPCPVLVVRDKEFQSAKERTRRGWSPLQFRKILVPVDFSESSRLGLDYALRFAQAFRANLVLFHSVFVPAYVLADEYTARGVPNLISAQQDYADDEMKKLRRWASKKGHEVETKVAAGSPVEQIGDYVTKEDVDLIITSTHGQSGLRRVFTGSTAERLVRHATCPVLVIPNRSLRKKTSAARS